VRYDGARGLQLFANASRSAEPPSFGELSGGAGVTPVSSQRAASFEVGMRVQRTGLDIDAAIYRARIHGELLALSDAEGNPLGTLNAGRTIHAGIEFAARWRASRAWTLSANYLGNAFRFDRDPIYGDDAIAGLPSQQLRAGLRWSRGGFHLEPNIEWVPEGAWIDHANSMRAPGYTLLGLRAGGAIGGAGWTWFADLRNLGDRRWIASTNVVADARGLDGRNYLPGEGRSFFVGVEFTP
jgi:iron complex outermembrane receptor protein